MNAIRVESSVQVTVRHNYNKELWVIHMSVDCMFSFGPGIKGH
jgi:hypothetical protein